MKTLKSLCIVVFALLEYPLVSTAQNGLDYWNEFVNKGATVLSTWSADANSVHLGTNVAGYELGRYGLHSLMWGHLAWQRSPEYSAPTTTDTQRRQYLQNASDRIATMTSNPFFKDISGCSAVSYRGPTGEAISRFEDGYKGWGSKRSMDAMVPLPAAMPRILKDTWYRVKIRCENSPAPSMFTTITIWLVPGNATFPVTPHYRQTYRGLWAPSGKGEPISEVKDDGTLHPDPVTGAPQPQRVWFRKGTVAILSCFSNISVKNLVVYQGTGSSRNQFYTLENHGGDYVTDINDFHEHWIRVGDDDLPGSPELDVWSVQQEDGDYVISSTAAENHPIKMPVELHRDDNKGVYAAAYLKFKDDGDFWSFDLEDCEIEYDLRISRRNTGYAESGMAFHFTNRTGDLINYIDGRDPDLGNEGGVYTTPEEVRTGEETVYHPQSAQSLVSFGSYWRPLYRYLSMNLRPDRLEVTHHRESEQPQLSPPIPRVGSLYYGGTPWNTSFTIDPDSLAYFEGHISEGAMAGAILRFCRHILDPATPTELRTHFQAAADNYITEMNDNILAKWISAAQLWTGSNDLFYGANQSTNLLGTGNLDDSHIWRYAKSRTGSMFLHARGLQGVSPGFSTFSQDFCDHYHTQIEDAFVPYVCEGRDTWLWHDGAGWWETYSNGIVDIGHYASEVGHVYMADAYGFSGMSDIASRIADNFVNATWNRNVGQDIDLYEYRRPPAIPPIDPNTKYLKGKDDRYALTDVPLLAKYDFTVWEILNDFYNIKNMHKENFALAAAQMAYAVRYGVPRNLRAEPLTVDACMDGMISNLLIRWEPPSDYPCGYLDIPAGGIRRPGSRLRWYHLERKLESDPDWSLAERWTIDIAAFQAGHKYPFLLDPTAEAGQTYHYRVCTQGSSNDITNLSDYTAPVTVTYPAAYAGFYDSRNDLLRVDLFPWPTILDGETRTLTKGVYYAPFNVSVEEGGTLILDPAVQVIFGDSCELLIRGTLIINGAPDCEMVTLTGVAPQGGGNAPGSWWGVSLFPTAAHDIRHAIIECGFNNLVLFDPGGVILHSKLRYALQHGVIIKNADDSGPNAQLIDDCEIYENGWANVFITHGSVDADGQAIPIYPIIRNSIIRGSLTGDGIFVADQAYPLIEYTDIHANALNGIRCVQVRGDVFANSNVTVIDCNIHNHESGAGVLLYGSNGLLRFNQLHGNLHGVSATDASILHGSLYYGSIGGNTLYNNEIHLNVENCSGIYFGLHNSLLGDSRGHANTFVTSGLYHIRSVNSSGFAQCNTYDPWDPYANPPDFDIPGFPMAPEIEILPLAPCIPPGGSTQSILTKSVPTGERLLVLQDIPELFSRHDDTALLELLQRYELDPVCRQSILTWLGTFAMQGAHKDRYYVILDSLSQTWHGAMLQELRHAGIPAFVSRRGSATASFSSALQAGSALEQYMEQKSSTGYTAEMAPLEILRAQIRRNDVINKTMSLLTPSGGKGTAVPRVYHSPERAEPRSDGLILYPNPAHTSVNLRVTDARRYHQCRIMDLLGRTVMTVDLDAVDAPEGRYTIDVSPLPRNRYILLLLGEDAATQKLFIRR